jgi:hypothetical protein
LVGCGVYMAWNPKGLSYVTIKTLVEKLYAKKVDGS